ncbi:MAG: hypothetical protein R3C26_26215 [Calditrichia bacterium]
MRQQNLLLVGFGMAGDADKDLLMNGGSWKASTAMFPEWVVYAASIKR